MHMHPQKAIVITSRLLQTHPFVEVLRCRVNLAINDSYGTGTSKPHPRQVPTHFSFPPHRASSEASGSMKAALGDGCRRADLSAPFERAARTAAPPPCGAQPGFRVAKFSRVEDEHQACWNAWAGRRLCAVVEEAGHVLFLPRNRATRAQRCRSRGQVA